MTTLAIVLVKKDRSGWAIAGAIFGVPVLQMPFTGLLRSNHQQDFAQEAGGFLDPYSGHEQSVFMVFCCGYASAPYQEDDPSTDLTMGRHVRSVSAKSSLIVDTGGVRVLGLYTESPTSDGAFK